MPTSPTETYKDGKPILPFESPAKFRSWLRKNAATSAGIWIKFAKKGSGIKSIVYAEALDEALCVGWIDSQVAKYDDEFYLQRFTPRGPKSKWSKINVAKVEKLIAAGRMKPAGQRQIDAARSDGRWEQAYDSARTMAVPVDLAAAIQANRKAAKFFTTISSANRYAILYRLHHAAPSSRAKRIADFVAMLSAGKTIH